MTSKRKRSDDIPATDPYPDGTLASQVKDSAQQIWLAGMGAFARAQEEGTKVFEALVKEGAKLQKKTARTTEGRLEDMSAKVGDLQARAGQGWDKLESIFEERTAKALKRLGVPSARDVDALSARLDALSLQVAKLSKPAAAKRRAAAAAPAETAAKTPSRRPRTKPAAAKSA